MSYVDRHRFLSKVHYDTECGQYLWCHANANLKKLLDLPLHSGKAFVCKAKAYCSDVHYAILEDIGFYVCVNFMIVEAIYFKDDAYGEEIKALYEIINSKADELYELAENVMQWGR